MDQLYGLFDSATDAFDSRRYENGIHAKLFRSSKTGHVAEYQSASLFSGHLQSGNSIIIFSKSKNINVITPEYDSIGQLIFRDNLIPMVEGRDILVLISTVNSGKTAGRCLECVQYYGGRVQGIAAVFSALEAVGEVPVYALFTPQDIPGYCTSSPKTCPMCQAGKKLDGLVNSYGVSQLQGG